MDNVSAVNPQSFKTPVPKIPRDCKHDLAWRAIYHNGEGKLTSDCLLQFNEDGSENAYKDIDRFRLGRFDLINRQGEAVYSLYIHFGQQLIYRRRNFLPLSGGKKWLVYVVGWQMNVHTPAGNKNIKAINYIFPDGTVALDDERNNLELYPEEH